MNALRAKSTNAVRNLIHSLRHGPHSTQSLTTLHHSSPGHNDLGVRHCFKGRDKYGLGRCREFINWCPTPADELAGNQGQRRTGFGGFGGRCFGRGFSELSKILWSSKYRFDIQTLKVRLETLGSDRNAVQIYLKKCVAHLLMSGMDPCETAAINNSGASEFCRYETNDIILPPAMKQIMMLQAEAERGKRAVILTSEGEAQNICIGTINCYVIRGDGIISLDRKEELFVLASEEAAKFFEIIPGVGLTIAGFATRCYQLRDRLRLTTIKKGVQDIDSLAEAARLFLKCHPQNGEFDGVSVYLAGFSPAQECLGVYYIRDGKPFRFFNYAHTFFNAMGSGGESGIDSLLRDNVHRDMPFHEAVDCVLRALINATLDCVCCGGLLQVFWVAANGTPAEKLASAHCIDVMLGMNIGFDAQKSLFFFSKLPYHVINYQTLEKHFFRLGITPKKCLVV